MRIGLRHFRTVRVTIILYSTSKLVRLMPTMKGSYAGQPKQELSLGRKSVALVVFLRGVNVGGHKTFRPSVLARELSDFDVVNVGAAGTFVVRKPGSRAKFRAALLLKLPFEAEVVPCE